MADNENVTDGATEGESKKGLGKKENNNNRRDLYSYSCWGKFWCLHLSKSDDTSETGEVITEDGTLDEDSNEDS